MSYVLYPDLMIIWTMLINIPILYAISKITNIDKSFRKIIIEALFLSTATTAEYILLINCNIIIHTTLYALTYIIMIIYFNKTIKLRDYLLIICAAVLSMMFIYGAINIFCINNHYFKIVFIFFIIYLCKKIIVNGKNYISKKDLFYNTTLILGKKSCNTIGFLDTGNHLKMPYSNNDVIVISPDIAINILDSKYRQIINTYCKTGYFDYHNASINPNLKFFPLTYSTVSKSINTMPVFKLDKILVSNESEIDNVYAGISKTKLSATKDYSILLSLNIINVKENISND